MKSTLRSKKIGLSDVKGELDALESDVHDLGEEAGAGSEWEEAWV